MVQVKANITLETLNAECWYRGDLNYLRHSAQLNINKRINESGHQLNVVLCSRGLGKTYDACLRATETALKKRSRIKIATEFQTDLEALILPNFEAVLEDCPDDLRPVWKASKSKFVFSNGSEIALIGLDRKPNGLRGQHGVDLIILEEAGFISKLEQLYRSVIVPTTTHRPECKIVLISTPPESLDHYFWTFVDRAELSGSISIFTIDDNPMLSHEDVARLENEMGGRESTQFQREYLCKRVAEASRMLTPEFNEKHVATTERDHYFPFWIKCSALDSGVRDLTTALWAYYDFHQAKIIIEDELVLGGKEVLTKTIFSRTRDIEEYLEYQKVRRYADNNNLILIQDLNQLAHEAKVESGHQDASIHWVPTRKDSIEASVNLVRTWLNAGRVVIHPRCKHLIGTLKTALWNKQRTDFQRSAVYGHADALMSLVYLIRNVDQHTYLVPQSFQADLNNSIVFERKTQSPSVNALQAAFGIKRTS